MTLLVFAMHVSLWVWVGEGQRVWSRAENVCSQGNYTTATIMFEDAPRSDHLTADVADDKTEIFLHWEVTAHEHISFTVLQGLTGTGRLYVGGIVNKSCADEGRPRLA